MKIQTMLNRLIRFCFVLLATIAFIPITRAQTYESPPQPETRVLLVFDTSSGMKKRLPEEIKGIKQLFALALAEQLQNGDSIGVWTFDQDVHAGQLPLQHWQVQGITAIASNVINVVEAQHYSKTTSFAKLTPLIHHVVSVSPRLLIIIFCDGDGQMVGTPYDNSVNAAFVEHHGDMRKAREPFVIALRCEYGQYTGSTISSVESLDIPHFPPMAQSPQFPAPPVAPAPEPTPPPVQAQPLIIIGNAITNSPPPPAPAPAPPVNTTPAPTPAPTKLPPQAALPVTNVIPPMNTAAAPTNTVAASSEAASPPPAIHLTASSEAVAAPAGFNKGIMLAIAGGAVFVIVILAWTLFRRARRPGDSLITESLKKS
jgi:hypothetical protein